MKRLAILIVAVVIISIITINVDADDCPVISIHYYERIPYVRTVQGGIEGLTASPTIEAFKKAGIQFVLEDTPPKRQLKLLKTNSGCDCMIGWFKNPEREKFAKYTQHIYQDSPQIILTRTDNEEVQAGKSVDSVLSKPGLVLSVRSGYSYGQILDAKIARYKPEIDSAGVGNINMLKKLFYKRNDYMFITPEEADVLIDSSGLGKKNFKYLKFSDIPLGEKRYILCSKKVDDNIIEKLNKMIAK